jgi:hypothetical protein
MFLLTQIGMLLFLPMCLELYMRLLVRVGVGLDLEILAGPTPLLLEKFENGTLIN